MTTEQADLYPVGAGRRRRLQRSMARWKRDVVGLMEQRVTVVRYAEVEGGLGRLTESRAVIASGLPCRILVRRTAREEAWSTGIGRTQIYEGYFPLEADLRRNDHVTEEGGSGTTYVLLGPAQQRTHQVEQVWEMETVYTDEERG